MSILFTLTYQSILSFTDDEWNARQISNTIRENGIVKKFVLNQ